jgi:DNA ligase-1
MMKLKRFLDDEAVVVGMEELMHNANPAFTNELGHTAHTSHQANQVPMMKLGALVVEWKGLRFKIGTGFSDAERHNIWCNGTRNFGRVVKFKYLEVGMKDLPRHPVFLGWRDKEDM